jgi:hypothetical protein
MAAIGRSLATSHRVNQFDRGHSAMRSTSSTASQTPLTRYSPPPLQHRQWVRHPCSLYPCSHPRPGAMAHARGLEPRMTVSYGSLRIGSAVSRKRASVFDVSAGTVSATYSMSRLLAAMISSIKDGCHTPCRSAASSLFFVAIEAE